MHGISVYSCIISIINTKTYFNNPTNHYYIRAEISIDHASRYRLLGIRVLVILAYLLFRTKLLCFQGIFVMEIVVEKLLVINLVIVLIIINNI